MTSLSSSAGISSVGEIRMIGLETVLQVQGDVLELADDGEIVLRQERMEILEHENRRLDLLDHLVQRRQRIFGGGVAVFLGLDGGAGGNDARAVGPFEDLLLALARRWSTITFCTRISSGSRCRGSGTGPGSVFRFLSGSSWA